jgi:hypothetical protein
MCMWVLAMWTVFSRQRDSHIRHQELKGAWCPGEVSRHFECSQPFTNVETVLSMWPQKQVVADFPCPALPSPRGSQGS